LTLLAGYVFTVTPNPVLTLVCAVLGVVSPAGLIYLLWRGRLGLGRKVFGLSVCLIVGVLFSLILVGFYGVYIEVGSDHLKVEAPPVFARISLARSDVVEAFLVDLSRDTVYRPTTRSIALGWGDYRVGWYILGSGEKALVLAEQPLVLCLRTVDGYYVMMGPSGFDDFLRVFNGTFTTVKT